MVDVCISSIIPAPLDDVWAYLREFNGLPTYFSGVSVRDIGNSMPSDRVGCIRSFRSRGETGGAEALEPRVIRARAQVKHGSKSSILDALSVTKQSE